MKRTLIALAVLAIAGYGLYEARQLIAGPEIAITSPAPGSATTSALVVVRGSAKNISFLTINDGPAYTDETGKFVYRFAPPAGYTVVTVAAVDRFGRRAVERVSFNVLNFCPA